MTTFLSSAWSMSRSRATRGAAGAFMTACMLLGFASEARAQLDPLLALKKIPPNVIIVLDTSFRMLDDGSGNIYDVKTYTKTDDNNVALALGVTGATYRRIYQGLLFDTVQSTTAKYLTTNIVPVNVSITDPAYTSFWSPTRWETAKAGLAQVVGENSTFVRWGLVKLRQNTPAWRNTGSTTGCDKPVKVTGNATLQTQLDTNPCAGITGVGAANAFVLYAPSVANADFANATAPAGTVVYAPGSASATSNILTALQGAVGTGTLIPASMGANTYVDRPIDFALTDARAQVVSTMTADSLIACRNTVIVLVTGGKDDGNAAYTAAHNPATTASTFASVSVTVGGVTTNRRVPIVVVGVKPSAADESQLQSIATNSGGRYFKATSATDVASAVNYAVQLGYAKAVDVDAGNVSEFSLVTPVVGTVNLVNAKSSTGAALPNTDITSTQGTTSGDSVPQRSNMLVTAGFGLPGFDGKLHAFRAFAPQADTTKATGWSFVKDGTKLWPDLDDRPTLAGTARVPFSSDSRNIYTLIPDGSGGGTMTALTVANATTLSPYLGGADAATVISFVRNLPIGAVIGSTPAIMDPPSLDPPPDEDYGFPDSTGTYAGNHKDRRSIIFVGANDGMIHAIDARTGYEVWAFIPFNLLPKLKTLMDGEPVEQFDYFVDSSPKLADIKLNGSWKTMLIIGESNGGTFYQAFDVSEAGMNVDPAEDGLTAVTDMLAQFDQPDESITLQVVVPRLLALRHDDLRVRPVVRIDHRDARPLRRFPGRAPAHLRRLEEHRDRSREARGLHLVRPGGRSADARPQRQRRDGRLGLLPRCRNVGVAQPRFHGAARGAYVLHDQRGHGVAAGIADELQHVEHGHRLSRRRRRLEQPQERAAGGRHRSRRLRVDRREPRLSGRHRRHVLAVHPHVDGQHHEDAARVGRDERRPDLLVVRAALHRLDRSLPVLQHGQRQPVRVHAERRRRHVQAAGSRGLRVPDSADAPEPYRRVLDLDQLPDQR